jgi:hypothetical protein
MDGIVKRVKDKFDSRSELGIKKYGTTLQDNNLPAIDWLNHLQEELMDAILYLEKLKSEVESNDNLVVTRESWDKADKITKDGFVYVRFNDLTICK